MKCNGSLEALTVRRDDAMLLALPSRRASRAVLRRRVHIFQTILFCRTA